MADGNLALKPYAKLLKSATKNVLKHPKQELDVWCVLFTVLEPITVMFHIHSLH